MMCSKSSSRFTFYSKMSRTLILLLILSWIKQSSSCSEESAKETTYFDHKTYFYDDYGNYVRDYQKTTTVNMTIVCSDLKALSNITYNYNQKKYDQFLKIKKSNISTVQTLSFLKFTTIKKLYLSNLHIKLILPEAFGGLSQLVELYLDSNEITEVAKGVYNSLRVLKVLDFSSNKIHKIEDLALIGLVSLESLFLNHNDLTKIGNDSFQNLQKLKELDLTSNLLEDFSIFGTKISFVNLSRNSLKNLEFSDFKSTSLDLSHNAITEIKNVENFDISNVDLSFNNFKSLNRTFQNLKSFNISNNQLEELDVVFENAHLTHLDFSFNQISSINEDIFKNLSSLNCLHLQHNNISIISRVLFQDLKSLTILYLSHNEINFFYFGTFDTLGSLEVLDISYNKLTNLNQNRFVSLVKLTHLYFDNNEISFFDFKILQAHHVALKVISLEENLWQCQDLVTFYHYLKDHNITIVEGHRYDVENLHGISCNSQNVVPRENSELSFSNNFSENFAKSISFKLQTLFNKEFQGSSFVKFFDGKYRESNFFKYFDNFKVVVTNNEDKNGSKADKLVEIYKPPNDTVSVFILIVQIVISVLLLTIIIACFYGIKKFKLNFNQQSLPQMEMC